ncbi:putative monovalent cation/H+ antiporter subunit B [Methanobrevibacter cuticularis]|uniref:Putative monovalent cation/H+ antiporter subunit B n=1 Tax=Methanobrevibacter cuticularis TaxID=47311 RepID=A0A166DJN6_9EURY|nr:EhbH [Methanobrevibacter cuticularis]KZX15669.1 putative monovalent cation/H+ antiporter subunit B [Methanobrevibacter cuticularis]
MSNGIRNLIMSIATALFAITLFDGVYNFKELINPGISHVYNAIGTNIEPNMVTLVVFDWRGYDTLGEALILVTAVVIVLLIFGRGITSYKFDNETKEKNEPDKKYNIEGDKK